jgi:hypothetical protein
MINKIRSEVFVASLVLHRFVYLLLSYSYHLCAEKLYKNYHNKTSTT